jgi:hypothetical protein
MRYAAICRVPGEILLAENVEAYGFPRFDYPAICVGIA